MTHNNSERKGRGKLLPVLAVLLLIVIAVLWAGGFVFQSTVDPSQLEVEKSRLDFGTVVETPSFIWDVPIRNTSRQPIHIQDVNPSCECTLVEPRECTIPPGGIEHIRLTIDLTRGADRSTSALFASAQNVGQGASAAAGVERDFAVQLAPKIANSSNGARPTPWTIIGKVRKVLVPEVNSVSFGDRLIHGLDFPPLVFRIASFEPIQRPDVEIDSKWGSVEVNAVNSVPDVTSYIFTVSIRPSPKLPVGSFQFPVKIGGLTARGITIPSIVLPVTGNVTYDVRPSPPTMALGAQAIGKTAEGTVSLWAATGRAFDVEEISSSQGTSVTEISTLNGEAISASSKSYRIVQEIERRADSSSKVNFKIRCRTTGEETTIPFVVSYFRVSRD